MFCKEFRKKRFYSQGKMLLSQMASTDKLDHYMLPKTMQAIFEVRIDSGLGGEEVEIAMMNDMHINAFTKEDEKNEDLMRTKACRSWNAEGSSIPSIKGAMDVAQFADQTVIAGDTLDFLSEGTKKIMKKYVFDRDPNVLCAVGSHEFSHLVQCGGVEKVPYAERRKEVQDFWIHDIAYATKDVKDKVICVILDNAHGHYLDCEVEKLQADIDRARKENKIILIFQHEPVSTGNPEQQKQPTLYEAYVPKANYYDGEFIFSKNKEMTEADKAIYEIMKNSTDVIKGIFCGHLHSLFYNEVMFETEDGVKIIPQYTCIGNTYFAYKGVVTRIFVK